MKRLLRLLTIAGAAVGAVWYYRQQESPAAPAPAEGTWTGERRLEAVPDPVEGTASRSSMADDLTRIKGIGPAYAQRLAAAGIATFTHLAEADPDALRAALDSRADVEDWIAQAKELAQD